MSGPAGQSSALPEGWCLAVELDPRGYLSFVDPAWHDVFPDERAQPGTPLVSLFAPADQARILALVEALVLGGKTSGVAEGWLSDQRGRVKVTLERPVGRTICAGIIEALPAPRVRSGPPPRVAEGLSPPERPIRVLVVEDHPINRTVAGTTLTRIGCEVEFAEDGQVAVDRFEADPGRYDIILMDCQMPVMDGYDATRRIRALEAGRGRVPIVAVTAHAMTGDREKCLDAGMDDYVTKPLRPGDLDRLVATYARRTRPTPAAPRETPRPQSAELDVAALEERLGGDRELLAELVDLLRSTMPDLLARVDEALAAGDLSRVREAAHTMLGAIGNFCAPPASAAATTLLTAARMGDAATAAEARDHLAAAWTRLEPELVALVSAPAP